MKTSEKINRGCEVNYGGGEYTASAGWNYDLNGSKKYVIGYQAGEMPMFDNDSFDTEAELIKAMREIALLSHWRLAEAGE